VLVVALLIFASILFYCYPQIDIHVASLFFSQHQGYEGVNSGANFLQSPIFKISTHLISALIILVVFGSLAVMIYSSFKKQKLLFVSALFILLCFVIGPGLIVNGILKSHWGRPRPFYVFTHQLSYVKVWVLSNQCHHNCSFVAGDSSAAAAFFAFVFLPWARRYKVLAAVFATLYFIYNAILRIIHGAHFFSDVIIGALLIYLIILMCYQFCFRYLVPRFSLYN